MEKTACEKWSSPLQFNYFHERQPSCIHMVNAALKARTKDLKEQHSFMLQQLWHEPKITTAKTSINNVSVSPRIEKHDHMSHTQKKKSQKSHNFFELPSTKRLKWTSSGELIVCVLGEQDGATSPRTVTRCLRSPLNHLMVSHVSAWPTLKCGQPQVPVPALSPHH